MQPISKQQIITWGAAVAVAGGVIWALYAFVMLGKISATVPAAATIQVASVNGGVVGEFKDTTSATARVAPGEYVVRAQSGNNESFAYAKASWFKTTSVSLDAPEGALNASTVAPVTTQVPMIQNGQLVYTSTEDTRVHALSQTNTDTLLTSIGDNGGQTVDDINGKTYRAQAIANNTFVANDGSRLIAVQNGQVKPLNTDGIEDYIAPLYAIIGANPNQASFTVTINGTVYLYTSIDAKPQKILETKKRISHAAYGGNTLILYSIDMPNAKEDITKAYTDNGYAVNPLVVDLSAKSSKEITGPISDASVSPNGKLATIHHRGSKAMDVVDMADNSVMQTMEAPAAATPFWINNDEFVYERNGFVRQFNVPNHKGVALGNVGKTVTSITKNGTDYLVSTIDYTSSPAKNSVVRLQAAALNAAVEKASSETPITGDGWSVDYSNITKPTLFIETAFSIIGDDLQGYMNNTKNGRKAALDAVRVKGIDPAQFTVLYSPSDAELSQ